MPRARIGGPPPSTTTSECRALAEKYAAIVRECVRSWPDTVHATTWGGDEEVRTRQTVCEQWAGYQWLYDAPARQCMISCGTITHNGARGHRSMPPTLSPDGRHYHVDPKP